MMSHWAAKSALQQVTAKHCNCRKAALSIGINRRGLANFDANRLSPIRLRNFQRI
jgi:hypothetical protein